MRRIAFAVLAIGAGWLVQSANAGPTAASCGRPSGKTLEQSASARAYTLDGDVFACAIPAGVPYRLGSASVCVGSARAAPVTLAGKLVAYGLQRCGVDTGLTAVVVRRLTSGKRLHSDPSSTTPVGPETYQTVDSLVLKANGSDAWIVVQNSLGSKEATVEVHSHDASGSELLDSGTAINPTSLRLTGSKLSWTHGGHKRSAKLH